MTYSERKPTRIKPNSAEYQRLHRWVIKRLGKATKCSKDSSHKSTRYDWSNISRQYLVDTTDWEQLCRSCHKKHDGISREGLARAIEASRKKNIGNNYHARPIIMIYPTGSWIRFPSSRIASERMGIIRTSIANALAGRAKTAGGFRWRRVVT